jgi:hypothetical protein
VDQLCAMQILEGFESLVEDVHLMHFFKNVRPYNRMQICFHEFKHQVQVLLILGLEHSVQFDNILMIELFQNGHLAISPLRINGVTKRIEYFFECESFAGAFLLYFPYMAVGTAAHLLVEGVFAEDVGFDLFGHGNVVDCV